MIGAKTIGHAILMAFDGEPILATDPWLGGSGAFFGSWQLSHAIPATETEELRACRYLWISHAHPDHLSLESLARLDRACILLPDHRGGRVRQDLSARGYQVRVLPDRRWISLSRRIRVCCIADSLQNALLLVDVNGRLFVDLNDASDRGWGEAVRSEVKRFARSYLLKLAPTGNLGVWNVFGTDGARLRLDAVRPERAGAELAAQADTFGVTHVIPFSSLHFFQRTDSAWANELLPALDAYAATFAPQGGAELLPAFVAVDCQDDEVRTIDPPEVRGPLLVPERFGDAWSDELEAGDVAAATRYFSRCESFRRRLGFVTLRVGGKEHRIALNRELASGLTFESPRTSLVTAIRRELFDDLLLGNFAKITVHGVDGLAPTLVPSVTRFADLGRAETDAEVEEYLADYRRRSTLSIIGDALQRDSQDRVREFGFEDPK
jgi:hypothetical protein